MLDRGRSGGILDAVAGRRGGEGLRSGVGRVALWLEPRRVTEDIDLVGLHGTAEERFALMHLAHSLGIPVEAVNSAADFFVRRIDGWREQLEVFRTGARATVYRPTATLFVLLKMRRLSERDLADCRAALARAAADGATVDRSRLLAALDGLDAATGEGLAPRRAELRTLIEGGAGAG